jgi:GntR family transcriptional repressor for pyruvate dehydrogenase complex
MVMNRITMKPIERVPITEIVAQSILLLISEGHLKVGDKLPSQKELGDMLKVSRPSLREALSGLIMMGIIEARAGQGYYLRKIPREKTLDFSSIDSQISDDQVKYLYEARGVIEAQIAELAAVKATAEDIQKLFDFVHEIEVSIPDIAAIEKGLEFHNLVAQATHNPILVQIEDQLLSMLQGYIPNVFPEPPSPERDVKSHLVIVEYINKRDSQGARKAALEHLRLFANEIGISDLSI